MNEHSILQEIIDGERKAADLFEAMTRSRTAYEAARRDWKEQLSENERRRRGLLESLPLFDRPPAVVPVSASAMQPVGNMSGDGPANSPELVADGLPGDWLTPMVEDWRSVSVEDLGLTASTLATLELLGCRTAGETLDLIVHRETDGKVGLLGVSQEEYDALKATLHELTRPAPVIRPMPAEAELARDWPTAEPEPTPLKGIGVVPERGLRPGEHPLPEKFAVPNGPVMSRALYLLLTSDRVGWRQDHFYTNPVLAVPDELGDELRRELDGAMGRVGGKFEADVKGYTFSLVRCDEAVAAMVDRKLLPSAWMDAQLANVIPPSAAEKLKEACGIQTAGQLDARVKTLQDQDRLAEAAGIDPDDMVQCIVALEEWIRTDGDPAVKPVSGKRTKPRPAAPAWTDDDLDAELQRALAPDRAAWDTWYQMQEKGATDEQIAAMIETLFAGEGHRYTEGKPGHTTRGGSHPAFWMGPRKTLDEKPLLTGQALIDRAREVMDVPYAFVPPHEKPQPKPKRRKGAKST